VGEMAEPELAPVSTTPEEANDDGLNRQATLDLVRQLVLLTEIQQDQIVSLRREVSELKNRVEADPANGDALRLQSSSAVPVTAEDRQEAIDSVIQVAKEKGADCDPVGVAARARQILGKRTRGQQSNDLLVDSPNAGKTPPQQPEVLAQQEDLPLRHCVRCGTTQTPKWRDKNRLCNACGLKILKQVCTRCLLGAGAFADRWTLTPTLCFPGTCFAVYRRKHPLSKIRQMAPIWPQPQGTSDPRSQCIQYNTCGWGTLWNPAPSLARVHPGYF